MTRITDLFLSTALLFCAFTLASAQTTTASCSFKYFTPPSPYNAAFEATGINHYGTVVGQASSSTVVKGWTHFTNGGNSLFAVPGSNYTSFSKRNLNGTVVGFYQVSSGGTSGLVVNGSSFATLNRGTYSTLLTGINKSNTIVGAYQNSYGDFEHGFRYNSGHFSSIAFPGAVQTVPHAVNDNGVIVGEYTNVNLEHAPHGFILRNGIYKTLDIPNSSAGTALGDINNNGVIVAAANLVYKNGVWKKVVVPNANETFVNGINDLNVVTGVANYNLGNNNYVWKGFTGNCSF